MRVIEMIEVKKGVFVSKKENNRRIRKEHDAKTRFYDVLLNILARVGLPVFLLFAFLLQKAGL